MPDPPRWPGWERSQQNFESLAQRGLGAGELPGERDQLGWAPARAPGQRRSASQATLLPSMWRRRTTSTRDRSAEYSPRGPAGADLELVASHRTFGGRTGGCGTAPSGTVECSPSVWRCRWRWGWRRSGRGERAVSRHSLACGTRSAISIRSESSGGASVDTATEREDLPVVAQGVQPPTGQASSRQLQSPGQPDHPSEDWPGSCRGAEELFTFGPLPSSRLWRRHRRAGV